LRLNVGDINLVRISWRVGHHIHLPRQPERDKNDARIDDDSQERKIAIDH